MSLPVDDFGGVTGRHWHQLAVLLRRVPENAADLLRIPPVVPFPDQHILQTLAQSAVSAGLKQLVDKHLLSCLLLAPDDQQKQWARQVDELLPQWLRDLSPETAMSCSWIRLPLLIARPGEARVVWMLLGRRPERGVCRCAGKPGPDEQTGVQIRDALVHGDSERGYIYWFLQQDDEPAVRGDSLGLAVALAARLLRKGQSWPPGLYASGTVESGGMIGRVGHLPEKYRAATSFLPLPAVPFSREPERRSLPVQPFSMPGLPSTSSQAAFLPNRSPSTRPANTVPHNFLPIFTGCRCPSSPMTTVKGLLTRRPLILSGS